MSEANLEIKISSTARINALREARGELEKLKVKADALGDTKKAEQAGKDLARVSGELGKYNAFQKIGAEVMGAAENVPLLGSAMRALNGTLGPVSLALAGVTAVIATAAKAVKAFAAEEVGVIRLNQALAKTGQFSDETSDRIQRLADTFNDNTGVADEWFVDLARRLVQAGVKVDDLERYTQGVVDLAGAMDGDLKKASEAMRKAIVGDVAELKQYGIVIDPALAKTERMDAIMRQAAQIGGGQLAATAGTLHRGFGDLTETIGDTWVRLGNLISRSRLVQYGLDAVLTVIKGLNNYLPATIKSSDGLANSLDGITKSADESAAELTAARDAGKQLAETDLQKLRDQADAARDSFAALTAAIRAAEQANIAQVQGETAVRLAEIDDAESTGQLSALEAAQARADAKRQGDEQQATIRAETIRRQQAAERQRIQAAEDNRRGLADQIDQTTAGRAAAQRAAEDARQRLLTGADTARQGIAERQAALVEAEDQFKKSLSQQRLNPGFDGTNTPEFDAAKAKRDAAKASLDSYQGDALKNQRAVRGEIDAALAQVATLNAALETLEPALAEAQKQADATKRDATGNIGALDDQLRAQQVQNDLRRRAEGIAQRGTLRTAADKDAAAAERAAYQGRADQTSAEGVDAATAVGLEARRTGDAAALEAARKLRDAAAALKGDAQAGELTELLKALNDAVELFGSGETPVTKRLRAQVEILQNQVKNLRR